MPAFLKGKRLLCGSLLLGFAVAVSGCGGTGGVLERLPGIGDSGKGAAKADKKAAKEKKAAEKAADAQPATVDERAELLGELKALREQLKKRTGTLQSDLAEAKAELARRQSAGEIDTAKVNLSPAQIRDSQLSELDALKAELERRRTQGEAKERVISTALVENENIYRNVDACLMHPDGDFRNIFSDRSDLDKIVDDKDSQVYRNSEKTLLILTSKGSCDISFTGTSLDDYTTGLVHILETQGGIVEQKKLAGIDVISVAHPRGNFRLASGKKVIGQGSSTNFYTTISAL